VGYGGETCSGGTPYLPGTTGGSTTSDNTSGGATNTIVPVGGQSSNDSRQPNNLPGQVAGINAGALPTLVFQLENDTVAGSSAVPTNPEELSKFQFEVLATGADCGTIFLDVIFNFFITKGNIMVSPGSEITVASCIYGFFELFN
jgi:hypothetical protein